MAVIGAFGPAVGASIIGSGGAAAGAGLKPAAAIATNAALIGGSAIQAAGALSAAGAQSTAYQAQAAGADFEAQQAKVNAGQERAASQRRASEVRRQQRVAQSRLQAVSAASGAGASDPTVTGIDLDLEEEGLYRASLARYEGEERARTLETGAMARTYEADQYRRAADTTSRSGALTAFSTLLGGFGNMGLRARYG